MTALIHIHTPTYTQLYYRYFPFCYIGFMPIDISTDMHSEILNKELRERERLDKGQILFVLN